ncbi:hypothetical protein BTO04_01785 [Polaribacter sp. SA4-10]|uniref:glycosyltransferase family A protein n=1 Tax=Polaribacter sp. SA4-10 TaxID=754397 RepID=UPI000B3C9FEF|nr:glycosyltransferase family A protein [Polaribacter sp. SA4-10]ARV05501.1 hypothetical protein BTO04_01785 [Polaribacter sp. SA4-10]
MRIGKNPTLHQTLDLDKYNHQVVIPVYIPNFDGYFKDVFSILKICLNSLEKTTSKNTFITIVNNGSCSEVSSYLNDMLSKHIIQELIHTSNIGKNKAIIKGVSGHNFKLITIADSDVLFLSNWQKETLKIFNEFPKASVVGLVPQFNIFKGLSFNLIYDNFFSKKLKFTKVKNPKSLALFYKSIGWENDYNKNYLKYILTLTSKNGLRAVVGSGHFVATYKKQAIDIGFNGIIENGLSPKYDRELLDKPSLKLDLWRLTTNENLAFHMGNIKEHWMHNQLDKIQSESGNLEYNFNNSKKNKILSHYLKNHIFRNIFQNTYFFRIFLRFKGLPKDITKNY